MFYVLKKGEKVLENFNAPLGSNEKADEQAVKRAQELGADSLVTSLGRVMEIPKPK